MNHDIFLCFRPQDAAPHAWMLLRDLTAAGYSVRMLPEDPPVDWTRCTAVLLLLSHDLFRDPSDLIFRELPHALSAGTSVIGVRLTGFDGFPKTLPAGLESLRSIPTLSAEGTDYDRMVFRLLTDVLPGDQVPAAPPPPADPQTVQALRAFASDSDTPQSVFLRNRRGAEVELLFRKMDRDCVDSLLEFQSRVVDAIPDGAEKNIFESLSREEFEFSLCRDLCIGAYLKNRLVGLLVLLPHPTPAQNLLLDLPEFHSMDPAEVLVVDAVLVSGEVRGFGLQKTFNQLADCVSRTLGIRWECTVVSPLNFFSLRNTIRSGFRFIGNFQKYHSTRNFFVKEL